MATALEEHAMRTAILASARGLGTTSPNPPVGCVILDEDGTIAGIGFHRRKGEPHAEANALSAAGARARGGTAVVTLEPCNHVGVTPACRQGLIDAGVRRVVIAVLDPTSRGDGGAAALRDAGLDVEVGVIADEALHVLGPWLTATRERRPCLTWVRCPADREREQSMLTALRGGFDVVIDADGSLQEGVPEGHGAGMFRIPESPMSGEDLPTELDTLFRSGSRTAILAGDSAIARQLWASGMIDRLILEVDRSEVENGEILAGYRIDSLTVAAHGRLKLVATHERAAV